MTMITPSYLGETIEYSSLHACRSTLEDPTRDGTTAYAFLISHCLAFPRWWSRRLGPAAIRPLRRLRLTRPLSILRGTLSPHVTFRSGRDRIFESFGIFRN